MIATLICCVVIHRILTTEKFGAMYSEVATDLLHFLNSSCSHFSASGNAYSCGELQFSCNQSTPVYITQM